MRQKKKKKKNIVIPEFHPSSTVSHSTRSATRRGDACCKCLWKVNICDVGVWERDEQQIDKNHDPKKNTKPHVAESLEDHVQEIG